MNWILFTFVYFYAASQRQHTGDCFFDVSGNIVDPQSEKKAIMTKRVLEENNGLSLAQIEAGIKRAQPGVDICWLDDPVNDSTGTVVPLCFGISDQPTKKNKTDLLDVLNVFFLLEPGVNREEQTTANLM